MCVSWVYGSVGQPKASKRDVPGSTPGSSCLSLVFIKNDKQNTRTKMLLFVSGLNTIIYNMYKSMTSLGVIWYQLFVLYTIYIFVISINKYYIYIYTYV